MIVYACKYSSEKTFILDAVASARSWMPEEPVLVVDSDSADISYFQKVESLGATVADAHNRNYETGAWWYAYQHSDATYFYFLHDSTALRGSLATCKAQPLTVFGLLDGWEGCDPRHLQEIDRLADQAGCAIHEPIAGVFGSMFACERGVLDEVRGSALSADFPTDKFGSECAERFWGILLADHGYDVRGSAWGKGEALCYGQRPLFKFLSRRT